MKGRWYRIPGKVDNIGRRIQGQTVKHVPHLDLYASLTSKVKL